MVVSSKTLYHFTKDYDTLIKILTSQGFWPKYCEEREWGKDQKLSWAVPMVCFTDIPFKSLLTHMDWYGDYGFGMSKDWAIANGHISPILYLNSMSSRILNFISKRGRPTSIAQWTNSDFEFFSLLKKYEGTTNDINGKPKKKILYDEREWRYIPAMTGVKDRFVPLKDGASLDINKKDALNNVSLQYLATFSIHDVDFLLIHSEAERVQLFDDIDRIFSSENNNTRAAFKSKIISREYLEQIV